MTQEIKTVMVLGGRGNLGPHLISSLLRAGFHVSVLSRSSSTSGAHFEGAPVVKSDYTFASLVSAFTGLDAVISTLSTANVDEQKTVIDAVAAAKVKRFIPSEFGSDTSVDGLEDMAPFLKEKQNIVEYTKGKEAQGLSWTAIFTGPWIDWSLVQGHGLLSLDIRSETGTLVDSGEPKFTTTTIAKVGEATAAVLLHPAETKNQYVHVCSFNTTQNQILEALERITGNSFAMTRMSNAELYARAITNVDQREWRTRYYELATSTAYSDSKVTFFPEKAAHWNKVLGLTQDETFDEMISRVLKEAST